ncbi:MAG: DNA gyrase subunit A [Candidatus Hydrogenedentota bacterium]
MAIEKENLLPTAVEYEMKTSYLDYAMSVIIGRALPDVRDGLKPVHRRIIFAMNELNNTPDKPFKKSARIVGEVIGKYHPHGDAAVYDTIVRMVQDFSLRYPLIEGQGNFGSVDGDPAAAMRYTEIRLSPISLTMIEDIAKETVDFVPNYDGTLEEPLILPTRLPNLIINGSSGIAVGMATNIPPHNLKEIAQAIKSLIDDAEIEMEELIKIVPAPDFPTGGVIFGRSGIIEAFTTGKGRLILGAVASIEEMKGNREAIIVTELPYQVNKANLLESIAQLVNEKKLEGIADIRDESDRDGMRIVIELKKDTNPKIILNKLFKHTQMRITFGVIMLALVSGQPKILNLKEMLLEFIRFRKETIIKRTRFELKQAEEKAHILEGFKKAIDILDDVITTIRKSKDREDAHNRLVSKFSFTDAQAKAILDLRLHRLTSLEIQKIIEELKETLKLIARLKFILENEREIYNLIKQEMDLLVSEFGDDRRTKIVEELKDYRPEDLIQQEEVIITITHSGYIKRMPLSTYKTQQRGGKGITGISTDEKDFVEHLFVANTHQYILFFTNKGKCYWLKVYDIPEGSRISKGKAIINCIDIQQDENITAMIPVKEFDDKHYLFMVTEKGVVKKTVLSAYGNPRKDGIIAISLNEKDSLVEVKLTDGSNDMIIGTADGMALRFYEEKVRAMGRSAIGVRGINLQKNDYVIGAVAVKHNMNIDILVVSEKGYAKRTQLALYRITGRGGKGIITMKTTDKVGKLVSIRSVCEDEDLMVITTRGMVIKLAIKSINIQGRNTQGVRIIKIGEDDLVAAVAPVQVKEGDNQL